MTHELVFFLSFVALLHGPRLAIGWKPTRKTVAFLSPDEAKDRRSSLRLRSVSNYLDSLSTVVSDFNIHDASRDGLLQTSPSTTRSPLSSSRVPYPLVKAGLDQLYPPSEIEQRNAKSRTDGYWPFIQEGQEPPMSLTYGEFELGFFEQLLDVAETYLDQDDDKSDDVWSGKTFVDIGSGTGRLVFAAAALHPCMTLSRGIELLPGIHEVASEHLERLTSDGSTQPFLPISPDGTQLPMSPIEFLCGSFEDISFSDANVVFFFSTCLPDEVLTNFAKSLGNQCQPGTIVITTDYMLPLEGSIGQGDDNANTQQQFRLSLLEEVDGSCMLVGGTSTAYIHRVEQSGWKEQ